MSVMLELGAAAAAGSALWAAGRCHDFFEGERLWADLVDEFRLGRRSLADLDRQWAQNPERSPVIVSLTTIPSRLPFIGETLKSLLRQTRAPARIVLQLPEFSRREQRRYELPEALRALAALEIAPTEDWGPATKLIPAVLRYPARQPILALDDDRIYPATLLADLEAASLRHPDCALGLSGWRVPADLTDRPTTVWSNLRMRPPAPVRATRLRAPYEVDILQGMSGYLVRPEFFDARALCDYSGAPEAVFYVDDVWISAHCRARKLVIPARRSNYGRRRHAAFFKSTSVALLNRGGGDPDRRNNSIALRHLRHAWPAVRMAADQDRQR